MNRSRLERSRTFIPPVTVVTRQSSDVIAVEDPLLAWAMRVIRAQAGQGLTV